MIVQTPISLGDITDSWLSSVLGQSVSITGTTRTGEGYGLASEVYRIGLEGFSAGSVIVKLWPVDSRAKATEVHFYNDIGSQMLGDVPVCFHAAADNRHGVLVLENLRGRQGDVLRTETTDQLVRIVQLLGRIHGRWWDRPELEKLEWLPDANTAISPQWIVSRREQFLDRFGAPQSELAKRVLDRAPSVVAVASERLRSLPMTLAHADHHLDNYLFVDERPVLLDWAGCRRGPGAPDLVAVLFGMGGVDSLDVLMDAYLITLATTGIVIDRDALRSAVGGAVLQSYVHWTLGTATWVPVDERSADLQHRHIADAVRMVEIWAEEDPELFDQVLS